MLCELLSPREDFRRLCGSTLHSCRIVTLVRDGEPEPLAATILLPPDGQHFSNARGLTTGSVTVRPLPCRSVTLSWSALVGGFPLTVGWCRVRRAWTSR